MGLDNFPATYPCVSAGTAVTEQVHDRQQIDCNATMSAGGCPWKNANPPGGVMVGMMGTYCWLRGAVYAHLIEQVLDMDVNELWGDLTPGQCRELAEDVEQRYRHPQAAAAITAYADAQFAEDQVIREAYVEKTGTPFPVENTHGTSEALAVSVRKKIEYFVWYLRWVADEGDGMGAWS